MSLRTFRLLLLGLFTIGLLSGAQVASARAEEAPEWRREQPEPPEPPSGIEKPAFQVGLGKVGDIEFYSPNRGALITAGNGSTVPAGVWLYNGRHWRELATECGASNGRIAWAGPDEFWTVSNGRPGQAANPEGELPPLEDDTLCRFKAEPEHGKRFEIVGSYATLGFLSTSYKPMFGAACLSAEDCWFGGERSTEGEGEAFQLHWNGREVLEVPYENEGHAIADLAPFEGDIYESLLLRKSDQDLTHSADLPPLRRIVGSGEPPTYETELEPPLYGPRESPYALDSLRLSSAGGALWAAAGPSVSEPEGNETPAVTILRYSKTQWAPGLGEYVTEETPSWKALVGPESEPETGLEHFGSETVVTSIAGEPGTTSAWVGLDTTEDELDPSSTAAATIVQIEGDGTLHEEIKLPPNPQPLGPTGATAHLVCPGAHDCWLVTTQGWLFHLSIAGEPTEGPADAAFAEQPGEVPLSFRPADESTPETIPTTLPEDDSGAKEGEQTEFKKLVVVEPEPEVRIKLPLLSHVHSKLIDRTTLDLSFHLAVKAQVQLIAKRHGRVVAKTAKKTFKAGNRSLLLRLNAREWPTGLSLKTHNLAPLPTASLRESNNNTDTVSTSELAPSPLATTGWGVF